jgi:hypothetical protein
MSLIHTITVMPVSYLPRNEATVLAYAVLRALVILPMWPLSAWLGWTSFGIVSAAMVVSVCASAVVWRYAGRWRTERSSGRVRAVRTR